MRTLAREKVPMGEVIFLFRLEACSNDIQHRPNNFQPLLRSPERALSAEVLMGTAEILHLL